ncbi:MAG: GlcNAc-PI de-N-acetylase [Actinobacteria bacterium]|nr:MAG: GlcNAc-PI de-N-acetylase [Actinomycetota bacterium]
MGSTVVFFHAHPDDEAIFTGGTVALLSDAGHRVVVVVGTGGELGQPHLDAAGPDHLGAVRRAETERAAALLGAARVDFLGYRDSGPAGDAANQAPGSMWSTDASEVADRLAAVLAEESPRALVIYDEFGIYGHPDHLQVHRAGTLAAARAAVPIVYEATVDREYLHFVETHLVEEAVLTGDLGLVRSHIGMPTVLVSTTVDVSPVLDKDPPMLSYGHGSRSMSTMASEVFAKDRSRRRRAITHPADPQRVTGSACTTGSTSAAKLRMLASACS